MDEIVAIFTRVWIDITDGAHAPLSFRLVIQPLIAAFFAIRSGMQDARVGRTAVLLGRCYERSGTPAGTPTGRLETCGEGLHCSRYGRCHLPGHRAALDLSVRGIDGCRDSAVLPYLVMRGLVNRILRHGMAATGRYKLEVWTTSLTIHFLFSRSLSLCCGYQPGLEDPFSELNIS
ncbi:MAG: hypothetical protein R3F36_05200 [Candidatus Competibacteraceae bacterium]